MAKSKSRGKPRQATEIEARLDALSRRHYDRSLADLLGDFDTPLARRQYVRLFGVLLKDPFSAEVGRRPSNATKASITLKWKPDSTVRRLAAGSWQVDFMRGLLSQESQRPVSHAEALQALMAYSHETALGKRTFEWCRSTICRSGQSAKILAAIESGGPEFVATAIGYCMPDAVRPLVHPMVTPLASLIIQIGIGRFCHLDRKSIEAPARTRTGQSSKRRRRRLA